MSTPITLAITAQGEAADPRSSAFVSANAGSGKTHVLINRVTRLLMAGVKPQNILCVTYTKAAASEMLNRLFERLGSYSIMNDADLRGELGKMDSKIPTGKADLRRARALFALALETPGGLKIRTIHAFCESLLRRFPAEAGISPGFTVLDDRLTQDLKTRAIEKIGLGALQDDQSDIAKAIEHVVGFGADKLDDLYFFAQKDGRKIAALINQHGGIGGAVALSAAHLGVATDATAQSEAEAGWNGLDHDQLKHIAETLRNGGAGDKKCSAAILQSAKIVDRHLAFDHLWKGFFTLSGTPPKHLPTAPIKKSHDWLANSVSEMQEDLLAIRARINAATVLQNTRAALVLSAAFHRAFSAAKASMGALDFDDLIEKSVTLVEHSDAAQWVLYKLDYNLSHILVDEAQDNSDGQWELIRRLSAEFFAGVGASDETRTLFAVGDPKQSIYSFQGANPGIFKDEAKRLLALTAERQSRFCLPELSLSWRSTVQVLAMVDETFSPFIGPAPETKFEGDPADYAEHQTSTTSPGFVDYVPHQAQRGDTHGSVELWDAIPRPPEPEPEDPAAPVDAQGTQSARNQLAATIARQIARWIAAGEMISEKTDQGWKTRPIEPGDIMILVRSRTGGLFEEIIRQLKLNAIAVAGADRMVLGEQTAVRDLISTAKATLLNDDDLSLAEFLKSPFLQPAEARHAIIDDQALFDLASPRPNGQSLSAALQNSDDPRFFEAKNLMARLRDMAGNASPFSFFATLLYAPSASGESYARRLYARLGLEAEDPVREFLSKALIHQNEQGPALARFIAQMLGDDTQIKREMEAAGNAVRVMTVHGAKGLEAPLVILPDTAKGPTRSKDSGLMFDADDTFFWSPKKDNDPEVCQHIRERAALREAQEQQRLLYVAMTRAQDRLVICGAKMGRGEGKIHDESWYAHCANAFARLQTQGAITDFEVTDTLKARRFGPDPTCTDDRTHELKHDTNDLPGWARTPLPRQSPAPRRVAPSRWLEDEDEGAVVLSPLADGGTARFRRGLLIHTLLQSLPDLPHDKRRVAAQNYLGAQADLDETQRQSIVNAVFNVLDHPEFAAIFGPQSRAELPISGRVIVGGEPLTLAGQIDRMVVTDSEVLVVDFKSNRPPAQKADQVSGVYLRQMAAYRALLRDVWPTRTVRCALLWTDGPNLMTLADSLLDQAIENRVKP